jgi:hypothetical protein
MDLADHNMGGNRQLAYSLSSTGRICKQTMTMNAGYLAHSQMTQGNGFYNLPIAGKATALVTSHSKFRESEA